MARQKNDGRGRMGGRAKGTPNKVTVGLRDFIKKTIDNNRERIEEDLDALTPRERLFFIERLLQYVLPKQQSVRGSLFTDKLTEEQVKAVAEDLLNEIGV